MKCITLPDDIDETQFFVHPLVPGGVTLGDLKGTPDYDLGMGFIQAFRDAAFGCDDTETFSMVSYPWLSSEDFTTPVSKYLCSTCCCKFI